MRLKQILGLTVLCLFVFQNCGSFNSVAQESLYTYRSEPKYFFDVQLVSLEVDPERRQHYIFDFVVASAQDPDEPVSYVVNFSTLVISGICQSLQAIGEGNTKHFRGQCLIPTPDDLYLQIILGDTQENQETHILRF